MQHRPRRLVGPQPQRPLDAQRGHAVLLAGHLPRRREPQPQRRASAVEDRPRRDRHLTPANRALPTTAAQPPRSPADAPRATEPVRPTQPLEVVPAGSLVRKPRQQLRVGARVILARLRHSASLPELDRYPPCAKAPASRGAVERCGRYGDHSAPKRRPRLPLWSEVVVLATPSPAKNAGQTNPRGRRRQAWRQPTAAEKPAIQAFWTGSSVPSRRRGGRDFIQTASVPLKHERTPTCSKTPASPGVFARSGALL